MFSSTQRQPAVSGTKPAQEPSQPSCPTVLSCLQLAQVPVTSTHQSSIMSTVSPSEPHMSTVNSTQETQDVLLPPSAFMTKDTVIITCTLRQKPACIWC